MKCSKCGADIKEGSLCCDVCGTEVRIVPDYSSLDEILAAHVRSEIESGEQPHKTDKKTTNQKSNRREKTKQQKPRKKKVDSKKKTMLIMLGGLLGAMLLGIIGYQNSYAGKIQKGYYALEDKNYEKARKYFISASAKNSEDAEAYAGLADVYIQMEDLYTAESILIDQIAKQKDNANIYRATAEFYEKTEQVEKIPLMLEACDVDSVLEAMSDYVVEMPEFSLEEKTYEEAQQLELSSGKNKVYYTLDGTVPTSKTGTKYGTTIQLDEGEWTIQAIAVNEKGIPSIAVTKKIIVELPAADPPIVLPSTGLYESDTKITVQVPEGFTAYYIFGQTELTPENGKKYFGPIKMPEGNHIFSAILVDDSTGKASGTTVRNYDLQIVSDEESEEDSDEKTD